MSNTATFGAREADEALAGFDALQDRFDGAIEIVGEEPAEETLGELGASALTGADQAMSTQDSGTESERVFLTDLEQKADDGGFPDISRPANELDPFVGKVVLYPQRTTGDEMYLPALITDRPKPAEEGGGFERRMTILLQPYDPKVGVSVGMMFGLALKKETEEPTFGSHTGAGGFEAGHITPTFVGAKVPKIGEQIIQHGDEATHKVGANQGGVPEAMTQTDLIEGVDYKTRTLDMLSPHPIGLKTHATLEGDNGLIVPEYPGALRTAMGAAANSLGEEALDKVGELVDSAIAGAPDA